MDIEAGTLLEQRVARLELQMEELVRERLAADAAREAEARWYDAQVAHEADARARELSGSTARARPPFAKPSSGRTALYALIAVAVAGSVFASRVSAEHRRDRWATCSATLPGVRVADARDVYPAEAFARPGLHQAEERLHALSPARYTVLNAADGRAYLCATPISGTACACAPTSDVDDRTRD